MSTVCEEHGPTRHAVGLRTLPWVGHVLIHSRLMHRSCTGSRFECPSDTVRPPLPWHKPSHEGASAASKYGFCEGGQTTDRQAGWLGSQNRLRTAIARRWCDGMLRVARPTASLLRLKNADIHMLGVRASRKSTGCGQEHMWGRNHAPCDQPQAAQWTHRSTIWRHAGRLFKTG